MVGALIARRAPLSLRLAAPRSSPNAVRFAHVDNNAYNALPGGLLDPEKKGSVAYKIVTFMAIGFGLPFAVAKFQTWKAT